MNYIIPAAEVGGNVTSPGPPGPTITDLAAAGASILRRPLRLTLQTANVLVVDQDGETRQERLLLPPGATEDILRVLYRQMGLDMLALDWSPDGAMDAEVDLGAWADSISIVH